MRIKPKHGETKQQYVVRASQIIQFKYYQDNAEQLALELWDRHTKPRYIKTGKKQASWAAFRRAYLEDKADYRGMYQCASCNNWFGNIEVDHKIKRSVRPDLVLT